MDKGTRMVMRMMIRNENRGLGGVQNFGEYEMWKSVGSAMRTWKIGVKWVKVYDWVL